MEWLKDNYLEIQGSGNSFTAIINPPDKYPLTGYHQLCLNLAEKINDNKQGKIYILYSGGVDSEYVLNVFLSLKIDIVPVIIKLKPHYNEHDIKYAIDFCESKKLKPLIIDLDFDEFVKSGKIIDIAEKYQIAAYQFPATFSALLQLDGTLVMGNHGPPHITKDPNSNIWFVDEIEPYFAVLKFFEDNKLYGMPFFLSHSSEQYFSFLSHPLMKAMANNHFKGKTGSNSIKWLVYNRLGNYDHIFRKKYTGYENIESNPIFNHPNLKIFEKYKTMWWGEYLEPYSEIIKRSSIQPVLS